MCLLETGGQQLPFLGSESSWPAISATGAFAELGFPWPLGEVQSLLVLTALLVALTNFLEPGDCFCFAEINCSELCIIYNNLRQNLRTEIRLCLGRMSEAAAAAQVAQ